jgi:hypothetical protein
VLIVDRFFQDSNTQQLQKLHAYFQVAVKTYRNT